jgi:hypothetical protein
MLKKVIPHVCIILALFTITYIILSQFNPIFNTSFFKWTLLVFSIAAIIASGFLIAYTRRD